MSMTSVGLKAQISAWIQGHDGHEPDPSHEADGIGLGMLARDGNPARETEDEDRECQGRHHDHGHRGEGHVIPEIYVESHQRIHDASSNCSSFQLLKLWVAALIRRRERGALGYCSARDQAALKAKMRFQSSFILITVQP